MAKQTVKANKRKSPTVSVAGSGHHYEETSQYRASSSSNRTAVGKDSPPTSAKRKHHRTKTAEKDYLMDESSSDESEDEDDELPVVEVRKKKKARDISHITGDTAEQAARMERKQKTIDDLIASNKKLEGENAMFRKIVGTEIFPEHVTPGMTYNVTYAAKWALFPHVKFITCDSTLDNFSKPNSVGEFCMKHCNVADPKRKPSFWKAYKGIFLKALNAQRNVVVNLMKNAFIRKYYLDAISHFCIFLFLTTTFAYSVFSYSNYGVILNNLTKYFCTVYPFDLILRTQESKHATTMG